MFYFIFFSLRGWLAGSGPLVENSINFFSSFYTFPKSGYNVNDYQQVEGYAFNLLLQKKKLYRYENQSQ